MLHLKARYGAERLEVACERALAHDSPHYRTVKTILAGATIWRPPAAVSSAPYAGGARFVRGAADLFADEPLRFTDPRRHPGVPTQGVSP